MVFFLITVPNFFQHAQVVVYFVSVTGLSGTELYQLFFIFAIIDHKISFLRYLVFGLYLLITSLYDHNFIFLVGTE